MIVALKEILRDDRVSPLPLHEPYQVTATITFGVDAPAGPASKKRDRPRKGQTIGPACPPAPVPTLTKAYSSKGKVKAKAEKAKKPPTVAGGKKKKERAASALAAAEKEAAKKPADVKNLDSERETSKKEGSGAGGPAKGTTRTAQERLKKKSITEPTAKATEGPAETVIPTLATPASEPPKKKRAKTSATSTRISLKEKEALAATDRVMYATVLGIEVSATAFYAVHYESTKRRDAAIAKLKTTLLKIRDLVAPVVCVAFGKTERSSIWTTSCGIRTSTDVIYRAIQKKFEGVGYQSVFEVRRRTYNQYDTDVVSVRFGSPPPWLGKNILVGETTNLVTSEPPGKSMYAMSKIGTHVLGM
ncbi:hypothetical protein MMC07_000260 [Pseudocyphellaria aurata]|nr:hypothetical protein [Pseudocyphellaria aurata]